MSIKPILASALITLVIIGSMVLYFTIHVDLENLAAQQLRLLPDRSIFDDRVIPLEVFEGTHDIKKISSGEEVGNFLLKARSQNSYVDYARLSGIVEWDSDSSMKYPRPFSNQAQLQSGSPSFARGGGPFISPGAPSAVLVDQTAIHTTGDSSAYSSTNVQVTGVDEPDHIKTDGKHIYVLNDRILTIIDAYPAEDAEIVSKTNLDIQQQESHNMFLNKDRLIIFYTASNYEERVTALGGTAIMDSTVTHAVILDVSDPKFPAIIKDYEVDGDFHDARMIGGYVYLISTMDANRNNLVLPRITERDSSGTIFDPEILYFDNYESDYIFNTVTAIDVIDESINTKTFLMGPTNTIYTSHDGLYITYKKSISSLHQDAIKKDRFFNVLVPLLPISVQNKITEIQNDTSITTSKKHSLVTDVLEKTYDNIGYMDKKTLFSNIGEQLALYDSRVRQELESTIIHKIGIDDGRIEHKAKVEVAGWLLNQFSMDEYQDSFRAVTTYENYEGNGRTIRYNGVHVMDSKNLNVTGTLNGIAPNENVFSARFIGDRLYLVTFERIDPFFVIDLSTDTPKILGELKIPGFSNYLHPYSDDYIVGIGRNADNFGVQQPGVKIALFDVSDVKNPSVVDEIIIGDSREAGSEALDNHKAFFLDQTRGILSLPIYDRIDSSESPDRQDAWYGFYVYEIDPQNGFDLQGTIKHSDSERIRSQTGYRSFYIDDALYTSSPSVIKINDLGDISNEINSVILDHP